jgi:hypothetical protein
MPFRQSDLFELRFEELDAPIDPTERSLQRVQEQEVQERLSVDRYINLLEKEVFFSSTATPI